MIPKIIAKKENLGIPCRTEICLGANKKIKMHFKGEEGEDI
jgi:hypothetical protein